MSTDYSVFVKSEAKNAEIRFSLEKILNCELQRTAYSEEIYSAEIMGLRVSLIGSVDYEDDLIRFSEYDFEITIDSTGAFDRQYSDPFKSIASIVIANMLSIELSCECIAVENVHSIIDRFAPD